MVRLRFDHDARFAIAAAFDAAARLGHHEIGPEHLILGIHHVAPHLLPNEISAESLESLVATLTGSTNEGNGPTRGYSPEARKVRALAQDLALDRGRSTVCVDDLIKAVRTAQGAVAQGVLAEVGLGRIVNPPEGGRRKHEPGFDGLIRVSDVAEVSYPQQIVTQVKTAVAEGRLIPGDRLPAIRSLADGLDLAPGTVAKAYKQLESERIVITAGAAGTVVAAPPASSEVETEERVDELVRLLRPVVVAAFHLGGTTEDLMEALRVAIHGVFVNESPQGGASASPG